MSRLVLRLRQTRAVALELVGEVWCGWSDGECGVCPGMLGHKVRLHSEPGARLSRVWLS